MLLRQRKRYAVGYRSRRIVSDSYKSPSRMPVSTHLQTASPPGPTWAAAVPYPRLACRQRKPREHVSPASSAVSGVGTLIAESFIPGATLTATTKDGSPRTSGDAKTTRTAELSNPTAGVTIATKTSLLLPGIPSETSGSSGEASPAAITGAIVGALAFLGILLGVTVFIWNRARKKKRLAHEAAIGGPVTPMRKRNSMMPFHAGAINVPVSSIYDYGGPSKSVSRGDSGVLEGANRPPPRPPRSPARNMNVTEGGWI
ncbi:hypothetical protein Landi51_04777 [Colletotrichum acutatum]